MTRIVLGLAVAVLAGVLLVAGVRPGELVLLTLYQAVFVIGPGLWLARIVRLPSLPERIGAGWALGTVAVALLFLVGGALGVPWIVWALPILALVEGARIVRDQHWPEDPTFAVAAGVLALCCLTAVFLFLGLYGPNPLTRGLPSGTHYPDLVFHIALVGEVLHHGWPFQDPSVAGEPLRYQLLPHLDVAAASFVTGLDPEVVMWRSQPLLAVGAAGALACGLGRRMGLVGALGLVPVAVLLLAGEIDVSSSPAEFGNGTLLTFDLPSPTELLAVPILLTVLAILTLGRERSWSVLGVWCLLGFGAMAAKVTIVPVVLGGVGFAFLVARRRKRLIVSLAAPLAALLAGAAGAWLVFYAGSGGNGTTFDPLAVVGEATVSDELLKAAFVPFLVLAPAWGALAYVVLQRPSRDDIAVWIPIGVLLVSLVPYALLSHPGQSQVYFLRAGLAAVAPLSAAGMVLTVRRLQLGGWKLSLSGVGLAAAVGLAFLAGRASGSTAAFFVVLALVAAVVAALTYFTDRLSVASRAMALTGLALAAMSLSDPFIDDLPAARTLARDRTLVGPDDATSSRGITADVRTALVWLRDHSRPDDVVAVNNPYRAAGGDPRYFYYSALAQRRVFLQGWTYSDRGATFAGVGNVEGAYPDRKALSAQAFGGSPAALRTLARVHDVRFLFVDRRYGPPPPPTPLLRRRYSNAGATIYRLTLPSR